MKRLRDGALVMISNVYGETTGTLVLNDWERQFGHAGYSVHTIRLEDGRLYRTEGRLSEV